MRAKWFGMCVAYTIAKYNMSMCALGMAEEFKGEVAVNGIWPVVPIWVSSLFDNSNFKDFVKSS